MLKKYRTLIIVMLIVVSFVYFNPSDENVVPVEKIDIPSGISIDLVKDETGKLNNLLSMSVYTFNDRYKIESLLISGSGLTIPQTRSSRQTRSNNKMLVALQKVIIYSEEMSKSGISDSLDILFANEFMNNMGWAIVCKGMGLDILKLDIEDFPSSADYIDGMIENAREYNFFSDNYKVMDMYVRVDAEGRNLVLPYIEIIDDKLEITGLAIFKNDKMVLNTNIEDARLINLLREDSVNGILELKEDLKKYASVYVKSKKNVSCEKTGDNLCFTIDLKLAGDMISNTLIKDIQQEPEVISKFERAIEQQTQKQCQEFVNRMKEEYKVDCLELGRVACAKYGRDTGVDWDEVVSNSDIKVNVKVEIESLGRGSYTVKNG